MSGVFGMNWNADTENVSANTRSKSRFYNHDNPKTVNNGLETLRAFGPKIWGIIPNDIKNISTVPLFKARIKKWIPRSCPCRLCKLFAPKLGFV